MDYLRPILVGVVSAAVIGGISYVIKKSKPRTIGARGGTIRPDRWTAWITVLFGAAMFAAGVAGMIFGGREALGGAALAAVFGLAMGGFMLPSVTSVHALSWSDEGVEGPAKTFGLTLGIARTAISWSDIVRTGETVTQYRYVQSSDGRRIYWSFLYVGHGAFEAELERRCPDLMV